MNTDQTGENVFTYVGSNDQSLFGAESTIFDRIIRAGMVVVDAGCGDGRLTKHLELRGVTVVALDLHIGKLRALKRTLNRDNVHLLAMDVRSLGIKSATADVFVLGFNVIDFIFPESVRLQLIAEVNRILKPGGYFVFSSHNPIGMLLSPRGLRSARSLFWRGRYLLSGAVGRTYFRDPNGLLLYQCVPSAIVSQVSRHSGMKFAFALNRSGSVRNLWLLKCFSAWPYYVFRAREG